MFSLETMSPLSRRESLRRSRVSRRQLQNGDEHFARRFEFPAGERLLRSKVHKDLAASPIECSYRASAKEFANKPREKKTTCRAISCLDRE